MAKLVDEDAEKVMNVSSLHMVIQSRTEPDHHRMVPCPVALLGIKLLSKNGKVARVPTA